MRVCRQADGYRYHCDGCGAWVGQVWLWQGRLLCAHCLTEAWPALLREQAARASAVSQALARAAERLRGRR